MSTESSVTARPLGNLKIRTDHSSTFKHIYIGFNGDITIYGLRHVMLDEAYSLIIEELGYECSQYIRDATDLALWAIDQNVSLYIDESFSHSPFFGSLTPTTCIKLPQSMLIMTERKSFPKDLTKETVLRTGTWNVDGEEWKIDLKFNCCVKEVGINDDQIDTAKLNHLYVRSDYYNYKFIMPTVFKEST
ncbi:TPA_asm: M [Lupinus gammacytorhabdovirus 1]|nr:TPA_asm: M [Lupinus gammacytorhabdovirus 1]